ncbi:uncharacterized protein [Hemitrygon akajei]|uniref:uncharacterized protein isoform X2 n=1 Tax=Hemitrygon akajei TaxID=2704970 RepID=UPI003BF9850E
MYKMICLQVHKICLLCLCTSDPNASKSSICPTPTPPPPLLTASSPPTLSLPSRLLSPHPHHLSHSSCRSKERKPSLSGNSHQATGGSCKMFPAPALILFCVSVAFSASGWATAIAPPETSQLPSRDTFGLGPSQEQRDRFPRTIVNGNQDAGSAEMDQCGVNGTTCQQDNTTECIPEMLDVVFLFDGSNSLSKKDLEAIKMFMLNMIQASDANTQFAIIQYSAMVRTELSFKTFQTQRRNLREIVRCIQLMESSTFTATGINFTINNVFTEEAGAREGAKKLLMVITDGEITPGDISLTEVIKSAQEKGIIRFAVGVGQSFQEGSRGLRELTPSPHAPGA